MNTTFIKVCLEDEIKYAEALLELLAGERDALATNNGDAIEQLALQKRTLAEQLETSAGRRSSHLLEHTGIAAVDMHDFIENNPSTENAPQLKALWEQLVDLLNQCRDKNRLNGSILDMSQRAIKQTIAVLQGHGHANELYGRAGKTVSTASGHSLTRV